MNPGKDTWILQCRPGFEAECGTEAAARTGGGCQAQAGIVTLQADRPPPPLEELVFTRQAFHQIAALTDLPAGDRINAILAALRGHETPVRDLLLENPDTNEGKELAGFLKKFALPLKSALAKNGFPLRREASQRLHLLFTDSRHLRLGLSDPGSGSPLPNGILRLKLPREAPSRSTLKLDEALHVFLDERERDKYLRAGLRVVDLGAAPGGWSWQMLNRGLRVIAVDNGNMDPALMHSGLLEHRREDGFRYRPNRPVDWLLCDMVERPQRIAELVGDWLKDGDCRRAVFNLKLPMKKRYECVQECLSALRQGLDAVGADYILKCKQLYHDREEVTAYVALH